MLRAYCGALTGRLRLTRACGVQQPLQTVETAAATASPQLPSSVWTQQSRSKSGARHCNTGYSFKVHDNDQIPVLLSQMFKLKNAEKQPRYAQWQLRHEPGAYTRYNRFKTGWRSRKIRGVKQLVKLIDWRRQEGFLGAKNLKRKEDEVAWPLQPPASY